jgi:YggT family protein
MKSVIILFDQVVSLYIWILIINAIISWLVAFNILNTSNRFVYSILDVSYKLTAPPLNYIRRFLPNLGSIDISPVILILILLFLRNLVFEMFATSPYLPI